MFNDISVCVNDIQDRANAVMAACHYAEQHGAKVTAIYIKLDALEIVRWQGTSPTELANQLLVDEEEREENAKALFESLTKKYDCQRGWQTANQSNDPLSEMLCTDVIFVDQPLANDLPGKRKQAFVNKLIVESKRPVLVIPNGWNKGLLAKKVLLGWNASAEAMRAISDALPILRTSDELCILDIVVEKVFATEEHHTHTLEKYLSHKGLSFKTIIEHASSWGSSQQLSDCAKLENCDLIVVGGYGHSRLRETIMGGMTDHLINKSTIPVLFSH